ncbi:MAG: electron transfer flavoprotein subunit alpha [Endomicrobium sp.]|nr:electron transfer flavoprotein subunit alpha [Endomicrobium sp.]
MGSVVKILNDRCIGCGTCIDACPFAAILMMKRPGHDSKIELAVIDSNKCLCCGACVQACESNAIEFVKSVSRDAVDRNLYNGVWVYAEQRHSEIADVVYELLNDGKRLANKLNTTLSAVLIGSGIKSNAQGLIDSGADKVYVCQDPVFDNFQDDPYTDVFVQLIEKEKPEIVLIGATNIGRSFAPRIAAKIGTGLTADCTSFEIDLQTRNLQQTRPAFGGNIMATVLTPSHRPQMATVRHKVFKAAKVEKNRKGEIVDFKVDAKTLVNRTKFLGFVKDLGAIVNITDANVIVAGGRGVGKGEGFKLLEELANLFNGVVGASKAAVDAGWMSYAHQIGQTGKTVTPRIYIACGISGQIQHTVGINSSNIIIAINKDATCPMMQTATYALEGDLYEIIPNIIKEIKSIKDN